MKSVTDFKKALQALSTIVVKAEAARGVDEAEFEAQRLASVPQRWRVRAAYAALSEDWKSQPPGPMPHEGWFLKTEARAEALFGPVPVQPTEPRA